MTRQGMNSKALSAQTHSSSSGRADGFNTTHRDLIIALIARQAIYFHRFFAELSALHQARINPYLAAC
jgi:hypothetical protein